MRIIEQSTKRLPSLGKTRGKNVFRFNHKQLERLNDKGETEIYWQCTHHRYDPAEMRLLPANASIRTMLMAELTTEVNAYINSRYDQGSQASYQALYSLTATPQAVKDAILPLWPWIQAVMKYYYGKKAAIRDGDAPEDVTWDFSQFDATDPGIALESFLGPAK